MSTDHIYFYQGIILRFFLAMITQQLLNYLNFSLHFPNDHSKEFHTQLDEKKEVKKK